MEQNDVREDDVEKLALEWCKGVGEDGFVRTGDDYDVHELPAFIAGYNKAKENTYTEEQVREAISVKDKLPTIEKSYLVYAPLNFPKNSKWLVAEYYNDVKGFYSESSENYLEDVTHWCELPNNPIT